MKRVGHGELLANVFGGRILDLSMPRHGACALCGGVVIDAVLCTFAKEHATMCF